MRSQDGPQPTRIRARLHLSGGACWLAAAAWLAAGLPALAQPYAVPQSVVAGGGGASTAGTFVVIGTAGQAAAAPASTGGVYGVAAGFWAAAAGPGETVVLTVAKAGTGSGTVTSTTPAGAIDCGATCQATLPLGTSVTLSAAPAAGAVFAGWSGGGCAGTGACTVTLTTAVTVTATFAATTTTYLLTVTKTGNGAGTVTSTAPPGAIACGSTCGATLPANTLVLLAVAPAAGSVFAGWSGACTGTGACSVLMDQAWTVQARFDLASATVTRYLAEGATSSFFDMRVALLNPSTSATTATLSFLPTGGVPITTQVAVPARTRVTVDPKTVPGLAEAEFSTKVESAVPLVVDRLMAWDATGYGAHAETAVASPALLWYLAEGATHSRFDLFYLLQNPNAAAAQVRVRYLRPSGAPLEKTYTLPPTSRTNIWVDYEEFPAGSGTRALADADVSAVIEVLNNQPIIVERAMYAEVPGQFFGAGHEGAGITAPALEWFLAEGATGPYFDLFVLIANPGPTAAQVEATYLLPDGTTIVRPYTVGPTSRFNIWVDYEEARLADTAVSTTIRATNGVPIIVERAMWWPGGAATWHEAHNSAGATATGTLWAMAEGEVDPARNLETYVLIANTSAAAATVDVTLFFEDGTSVVRTFGGPDPSTPIPARSRFNVPVGYYFPEAAGKRFGVVVESTGATPAQLVVERAMYWDAAGQGWAAGTNALATRLR